MNMEIYVWVIAWFAGVVIGIGLISFVAYRIEERRESHGGKVVSSIYSIEWPNEKSATEKADIEKRIKILECDDHDWTYLTNQFTQTGLQKECKNCGKTVGMDYEHWLEEQSEMHYEEHCKFVNELNELYQQQEEGSK